MTTAMVTAQIQIGTSTGPPEGCVRRIGRRSLPPAETDRRARVADDSHRDDERVAGGILPFNEAHRTPWRGPR
ncbi:hypothetical protein ACFPRL_08585 [Pseudoclavibacter helvolus]